MQSQEHDDEQTEIPCVLMRGGTSKALFFHESDIPPPGPARDRMLKRAMGTPDVLQIDGMGGSKLVTSKIAIIKKSQRADADVDYTFAQVDVERDLIGYDANCGNISSAVAPFSIDEALVDVTEPMTTVRIHNTNTGTILVSKVQVKNGKARVSGDCAIAGVPGTGSEILMDYTDTIGAKTGKLLPTGLRVDMIDLEDGRRIEVSIVDAATPCVFIAAHSLGLSGSELPPDISADRALIETIGEIQSKAGERIGLYQNWKDVHLPGLPLAVMVAPAADYVDTNHELVKSFECDLRARLVFLGKCHDSMAGTGSMCTAAASRVPGTLVNDAVGKQAAADTLRIGHPLGVMTVKVLARQGEAPTVTRFDALGMQRTARRLMSGMVYVPRDAA
jgi:2-methylaconitate cis-trans-isomerase PrpF